MSKRFTYWSPGDPVVIVGSNRKNFGRPGIVQTYPNISGILEVRLTDPDSEEYSIKLHESFLASPEAVTEPWLSRLADQITREELYNDYRRKSAEKLEENILREFKTLPDAEKRAIFDVVWSSIDTDELEELSKEV